MNERAASALFGSSVSLGIVPAMSYSPNAIRAAAAHSTLCMLRESRKRITAEGSLLPSRYVQLQDGREEEKGRDREKEPSKRHVTPSLALPPTPMKEAVLLRGVSNLYDCMKAAFSIPGNA